MTQVFDSRWEEERASYVFMICMTQPVALQGGGVCLARMLLSVTLVADPLRGMTRCLDRLDTGRLNLHGQHDTFELHNRDAHASIVHRRCCVLRGPVWGPGRSAVMPLCSVYSIPKFGCTKAPMGMQKPPRPPAFAAATASARAIAPRIPIDCAIDCETAM